MNDIQIKTINSLSPEYKGVWELREEVLRKPLGLSLKNEDLSRDALDAIIIALENENVVGCVMLHPIDADTGKLRAMAVAPGYQNKGIGRLLVQHLEKVAAENGYKKISLHARQVAIEFYKKSGYNIVSNIFTEVGIPHVVMEKLLDK